MKIRNTEFSIHFVRNSNGDYSVDIRKFIGKLLATVLIIYIIIASAVILVEQLIEDGHDSSLKERLEYCESQYLAGDYAQLKLSLKYYDSTEEEFGKYYEIVEAYRYELEAIAFYQCEEEGTTADAAKRYENAIEQLTLLMEETEYPSNSYTIQKWLKDFELIP